MRPTTHNKALPENNIQFDHDFTSMSWGHIRGQTSYFV